MRIMNNCRNGGCTIGEEQAERYITVVQDELEMLRAKINSGKGRAVHLSAAATQSGSPVQTQLHLDITGACRSEWWRGEG